MKKVDIVDCVKQIIAINKELEEHDQRQDYHVTWMSELRDRIERLEKLQATSDKPLVERAKRARKKESCKL